MVGLCLFFLGGLGREKEIERERERGKKRKRYVHPNGLFGGPLGHPAFGVSGRYYALLHRPFFPGMHVSPSEVSPYLHRVQSWGRSVNVSMFALLYIFDKKRY